jgi:hypothetical protein
MTLARRLFAVHVHSERTGVPVAELLGAVEAERGRRADVSGAADSRTRRELLVGIGVLAVWRVRGKPGAGGGRCWTLRDFFSTSSCSTPGSRTETSCHQNDGHGHQRQDPPRAQPEDVARTRSGRRGSLGAGPPGCEAPTPTTAWARPTPTASWPAPARALPVRRRAHVDQQHRLPRRGR